MMIHKIGREVASFLSHKGEGPMWPGKVAGKGLAITHWKISTILVMTAFCAFSISEISYSRCNISVFS